MFQSTRRINFNVVGRQCSNVITNESNLGHRWPPRYTPLLTKPPQNAADFKHAWFINYIIIAFDNDNDNDNKRIISNVAWLPGGMSILGAAMG